MTWATEHFTHEWAERKGEGVYCVTCLPDEPLVRVLTADGKREWARRSVA